MSDTIVSKVGVHCVGPRRSGYGAFLQTIKASGRQLAGVKVRDDYGAIDEPVALWPEIITIGAATAWDDAALIRRENMIRRSLGMVEMMVLDNPEIAPLLNVEEAFARIMAAKQVNPNIVYWEYLNERNGQYNEQADFYIALMDRFASNPTPLCIFNCASGTPPYPSEDGGVAYAAIARACKYAKDHGIDVILGLHEYVNGGTMGRYKVLADYLEAHDALIPIAITEWLFETHPGDAEFMRAVRQYDQIYMPDPRVLFVAAWTLGGAGWGGSNYENALSQLRQYIATVAPVVIDPPPSDAREFDHWINFVTGENLGTDATMPVAVNGDMHVRAISRPKVIKHTLIVDSDSADVVVSGGGVYNHGQIAQAEAVNQ